MRIKSGPAAGWERGVSIVSGESRGEKKNAAADTLEPLYYEGTLWWCAEHACTAVQLQLSTLRRFDGGPCAIWRTSATCGTVKWPDTTDFKEKVGNTLLACHERHTPAWGGSRCPQRQAEITNRMNGVRCTSGEEGPRHPWSCSCKIS